MSFRFERRLNVCSAEMNRSANIHGCSKRPTGLFSLSPSTAPFSSSLPVMDDVENEIVDWTTEDDEQQQPIYSETRPQALEDIDADDAVSLGDEEEQLEYEQQQHSQQYVPPPASGRESPRGNWRRDEPSAPVALTAPHKTNNENHRSNDRSSNGDHDYRRRSDRDHSPARSQASQNAHPRMTHALPPKPVVTAATGPTGSRGNLKSQPVRTSGGDAHASNGAPSSPNQRVFAKHEVPSDWVPKVSSRGDTYYYNTVTHESKWDPTGDTARPERTISRETDVRESRRDRNDASSSAHYTSPTLSDDLTSRTAISHRPSREPLTQADRSYRPSTSSQWEREPTVPRQHSSHQRQGSDRGRVDEPAAPATRSRQRQRSRSLTPLASCSYTHAAEKDTRPALTVDSRYNDRISAADRDAREQGSRSIANDSRRSTRRNSIVDRYAHDECGPQRRPPRLEQVSPERQPDHPSSTLSASSSTHSSPQCAGRRGIPASSPSMVEAAAYFHLIILRLLPVRYPAFHIPVYKPEDPTPFPSIF